MFFSFAKVIPVSLAPEAASEKERGRLGQLPIKPETL
jgi:hypothetical protein